MRSENKYSGSKNQLCKQQQKSNQPRSHRHRDYSLGSIYNQDSNYKMLNAIKEASLPKGRKNESSNISYGANSFFNFHSTYLSSFNKLKINPEDSHSRHQKNKYIPRLQSLQEYASTYTINHHQFNPSKPQQAFKISDPQFYNMKIPFAKATQYSKSYKARQTKNQTIIEKDPPAEVKNHIRLFETTQKNSFNEKNFRLRDGPIMPVNNISTLPTSSGLYKTTYRQQFPISQTHQQEAIHSLNHYNF